MAEISKIGVRGVTYDIKDEVARAQAQEAKEAAAVWNSDNLSAGSLGLEMQVAATDLWDGKELNFGFIAGGVRYYGIKGSYGEGGLILRYKIADDSYSTARDYYNWELPNRISAVDETEFENIYRSNTNFFSNYTELFGIRIKDTLLTEETIESLKGLEAMGTIRTTTSSFDLDYNYGVYEFIEKGARFVHVHGGFSGERFYPIWKQGEYDNPPDSLKSTVVMHNCWSGTNVLVIPMNGMTGDPIIGEFSLTFYR